MPDSAHADAAAESSSTDDPRPSAGPPEPARLYLSARGISATVVAAALLGGILISGMESKEAQLLGYGFLGLCLLAGALTIVKTMELDERGLRVRPVLSLGIRHYNDQLVPWRAIDGFEFPLVWRGSPQLKVRTRPDPVTGRKPRSPYMFAGFSRRGFWSPGLDQDQLLALLDSYRERYS